jgi:hypothetical protein
MKDPFDAYIDSLGQLDDKELFEDIDVTMARIERERKEKENQE